MFDDEVFEFDVCVCERGAGRWELGEKTCGLEVECLNVQMFDVEVFQFDVSVRWELGDNMFACSYV